MLNAETFPSQKIENDLSQKSLLGACPVSPVIHLRREGHPTHCLSRYCLNIL